MIIVDELNIEAIQPGTVSRFWLALTTNALGEPICIPVMVAKGAEAGHSLGLTAALHGDELNGIIAIQKIFSALDPHTLKGTLIGVPVMNIPGYLRGRRVFTDGRDLNRIMPGKMNGAEGEIYAYLLADRLLKHFTHLIDLHTASSGRINPYYIRADMSQPAVARMAQLQNAQIILNTFDSTSTFRRAAQERGIVGITSELCDPRLLQHKVIEAAVVGIRNVMVDLGMVEGQIVPPDQAAIECHDSFWMYTDTGGILDVLPEVASSVRQGDVIALQYNVFGDVIQEYVAPVDGVVIGKSVQPVSQNGARILRLGMLH